jgi:DNA-binding transcriptional MerR regulator/effector-binding domain-containing protein
MLSIGDFAQLGQVSPRMLRHYDQLGILRPEKVDAATGYRSYGTAQLARLHKLLALRDLGFTLEQIGELMRVEPPVEELRGMLKLRRAEIEQRLDEEKARLGRAEAHLHALEEPDVQLGQRVVIKTTEPLRVAQAVGSAPDLGPPNVMPVMRRLIPLVLDHLSVIGLTAGMLVIHIPRIEADDHVDVHGGFDIGRQTGPDSADVRIVDWPQIEVASLIHQGAIEKVGPVYSAFLRWIEAAGYLLAGGSRELYHDYDPANADAGITELQLPITR